MTIDFAVSKDIIITAEIIADDVGTALKIVTFHDLLKETILEVYLPFHLIALQTATIVAVR